MPPDRCSLGGSGSCLAFARKLNAMRSFEGNERGSFVGTSALKLVFSVNVLAIASVVLQQVRTVSIRSAAGAAALLFLRRLAGLTLLRRLCDNRTLMQRLGRVLGVVLALLIAAAPLAECVLDESVASQMACCMAKDHDCGSAAMSENCCPTDGTSSRQLVTSAAAQVHPAPSVATGPAAWVAPVTSGSALLAACEAFDREILKLPERPTYLLVSSFLI
jgi:hypothetical protein